MSDLLTPTRVFLSYARGDDEAFVRRLHDDLTAAGFAVWFDRESLMSRGKTFHQEIKDAIRTEVDRVVYIGGPRAAVSAYVREEWKFALECDHVSVSPILRLGEFETSLPGELSLLHCEDFRDDAKYGVALEKLIQSLRQPIPKLGALFAVPSLPANIIGRPDLMRRIRDALLVDLQKPQVITSADARVGMQGMGGIGKSVLAAAVARDTQVRRSYPDGIVWVSFGRGITEDNLLRRQRDIVAHFGGDTGFQSITQGQGVLRQLLQAKAVLLVLDDVWHAADAAVFDVVGPRCRILVTTRDSGILHTLGGELVPVSLFTPDESLQLLATTLDIAVAQLPPEAIEVVNECGNLPLAVALCGGMAKKRQGQFESVLERLRRADLEGIADRHSVNPQHRDIWRAMHASVEMLSEEYRLRFGELSVFATEQTVPEAAVATLWAHTGQFDEYETEDALIDLAERSLIQLTTLPAENGKPQRRFRLHDLLYDYAFRTAGDRQLLHQKLLSAYGKKSAGGWHTGPHDGYFLNHLRNHLVGAGQSHELAALLHELRWLEAKNQAGLLFDLLSDYAAAINAVPETNDSHRSLKLLDEALRRDIHFIHGHRADYPQALFQSFWNSCWWYDHPDAAQHYTQLDSKQVTPDDSANPRLKLFDLLEKWRQTKEVETPGFIWARSLRAPVTPLGSGQRGVMRLDDQPIVRVRISPDGQQVVSLGKDGTVRVWDAATLFEIASFKLDAGGFVDMDLAPNGHHVAVAGMKDVWIVNLLTQQVLVRIDNHPSEVTAVAYAPDGVMLGTCAKDGTIHLWNTATGAEIRCLTGHLDPVNALAFSRDGTQRIATVSGEFDISDGKDRTVRVWDVEGRQVACFSGNRREINAVAYSRNGKFIASGCGGDYDDYNWDDAIRVWDAITGELRWCLEGHERAVLCIDFSPQSEWIVSGSADGSVRVWDLATGKELVCFLGHSAEVTSVCVFPNGQDILSASADGTARIWSLRENDSHVDRHDLRYSPDNLSISPTGDCVVCTSAYGVGIFSGAGIPRNELPGKAGGTILAYTRIQIGFSPDGSLVAISSGSNGGATVVYTATAKRKGMIQGQFWGSHLMALSADGECLAVATDETVNIFCEDKKNSTTLNPGFSVSCLAFSPTGETLAVADEHRTVVIYACNSMTEMFRMMGSHNAVRGGAYYSIDGREVVIWGVRGAVLYSLEQRKVVEYDAAQHNLDWWKLGPSWHLENQDLGTAVVNNSTGEMLARVPLTFDLLKTSPSGVWAGLIGNRFEFFKVEGRAAVPRP